MKTKASFKLIKKISIRLKIIIKSYKEIKQITLVNLEVFIPTMEKKIHKINIQVKVKLYMKFKIKNIELRENFKMMNFLKARSMRTDS
jgi:hypothetical protein